MQCAFDKFWCKQTAYPKFKKKGKSRDSATYFSNCFTYRDGRLKLAKQSEPLNISWSRPLPAGAVPSQVTVSKDTAGRYHVSILLEDTVVEHEPTETAVGVDAGITSLYTFSTGEKVPNPRHEKRDHLHKLSTRLVRENQVIAIEDLSVRNMVRNRSLARAISDASWSEFRSMLEYTADWYGRTVVAIDRYYPSSKTCSTCGRITDKLPLNVREWTCPCGAVHDRDVNAAKNIQAAGLAVLACGDGVRPSRS